MKDPTCIHPLAERGELSGKIRFVHKDGKEHSFTSVVNRLTGSRLSYFDGNAPSINDPLQWVKSVFWGIRKKATSVTEVIGDF